MPGNQQEALMLCGCCGCVGGCFPYTCTNNVCTLQNIPWSIDAPNCPAIDNLSGTFTPFSPSNTFTKGICGPCVCYQTITSISLPGKVRIPAQIGGDPNQPPGICTTFDCNINLNLYLGFDTSITGCCNMSLVVEMLTATLALNSGIPQKPNTIACIPQAIPVDDARFRQFGFDSCTCLTPLNQGAGFSALFSLSKITWVCKNGNWPVGNPCYPYSQCCELFGCSLAGATLSI